MLGLQRLQVWMTSQQFLCLKLIICFDQPCLFFTGREEELYSVVIFSLKSSLSNLPVRKIGLHFMKRGLLCTSNFAIYHSPLTPELVSKDLRVLLE